MKITGILIVHNEERLIEQALRSMRPMVDELLVCHDGPCNDRSLELARPFADEVFVAEFRGAPEANWIKMMRRATYDWILKIDCDETFSEGMSRELERLRQNDAPSDVTHYLGIWRAVWKEYQDKSTDDFTRRIAPKPGEVPTRLVLFRKSATRWVGIPHRLPDLAGKGQEIRECVLHWGPHQEYSIYELLTRKVIPFAKNDAMIRVVHPLEVYGFAERDPYTCLCRRDRIRHDFPMLTALPFASVSFAHAVSFAAKSRALTDLRHNLRWPLVHGIYQLFLGYNIARCKWEARRLNNLQRNQTS